LRPWQHISDDGERMLRVHWRAVPLLVPLAVVAMLPAMLVWAAALATALGLGQPLASLPTPGQAATRLERLLLLGTFWAITLAGPLAAAVLGVLAVVEVELVVDGWDVRLRLRLPAPPWRGRQLIALLLVGLASVLFVAMAGHLAADCLLGADC
jgi:hypothetical protein